MNTTLKRGAAVLVVLALALVGLAGTAATPAGAATNRVLVIAAADVDYVADVVAGLQATGGYAAVDVVNFEDGDTLDPAVLATYDAALVMADSSWPDADVLGTQMADFVDAGGRVVVSVFTLYCAGDGSGLGGRWATGNYGALVGDVTCEQIDDDGPLGIIPVIPDSPFLVGGLSFDGGSSSYRNTVDVGVGATLVATWDDGADTPFLAFKAVGTGFVVGLNFFPPSSTVRADFWTAGSGGFELLVNALGAVGPEPTTTTTAAPTTTTTAPPVVAPAFTG